MLGPVLYLEMLLGSRRGKRVADHFDLNHVEYRVSAPHRMRLATRAPASPRAQFQPPAIQ